MRRFLAALTAAWRTLTYRRLTGLHPHAGAAVGALKSYTPQTEDRWSR